MPRKISSSQTDDQPPAPTVQRTAVIGAGLAGCAAAYRLKRQGVSVVLFEAAKEVGGRTLVWRKDGLHIDSGAGFFTNFYTTLWPLLDELGLVDDIVALSRSNFLQHTGQLAELKMGSIRSFVTFPWLRTFDKVRLALQTALITLRYRGLQLSSPESLSRMDDASIANDAIARVGDEAYQILIRSAIEPFWYFSCRDVSRSLALALQAQALTVKFYTLQKGMDTICRALTRGLDLRTNTPVLSLRPHGKDFLIGHGQQEEIFDSVIIATTASRALALVKHLDNHALSPLTRAFLASQTYVPNIHAAFLVPRAHCPPDTSALFPCGRGRRPIAALNFNSHKHQTDANLPADQELVSVFLDAKESAKLRQLAPAELYDACWRRARQIYPGFPGSAEPFAVVVRVEAIPVHAVGRYRLAADVLAEQQGAMGLAGDYLATATVDGALCSGFRAARMLGRSH